MECKHGLCKGLENCSSERIEYGGCKTCYKMIDLKVGQEFYVINGDWKGKIVLEENVKCVHVYYTGDNFEIPDDKTLHLKLDNYIIKDIYFNRSTEDNYDIIDIANENGIQNADNLKYLGYEVKMKIKIDEYGDAYILEINDKDISNKKIKI